jgi:hypothetical protein
MKKVIAIILTIVTISSCKETMYVGSVGQQQQTQVVLTNSNFKVLGSFEGSATYSKMQTGIKNKEGIVSAAKADFIHNAKAAGVELTGSRAIVNVVTDVIENKNRITVTYAAEVIEFTR